MFPSAAAADIEQKPKIVKKLFLFKGVTLRSKVTFRATSQKYFASKAKT